MIRKKCMNHCGLMGLMHPICGFFAAISMLLMTTLCMFLMSEPTSAASTAGFQPGNIISDAVMGDYNSMSIDDIQRFLTSKNNCGNRNEAFWRQLENQYPNRDWHFQNGHFVCLSEERFGNTWTEIGWGETAAEIIYHAAQDFRINPQVLIVLLQKEQGLITDQYPNNYDYRSATGYGCPDTAACDSKYYGFKNQVRLAAQLFRTVLDGGWSNYPAYRTTYVQYNPNRSCGGTNVYIENRATSALYRYTPYQPNASALAAGYGVGDACGAYGNRNFYLYFSDWFGDTHEQVFGSQVIIPDGEYGLVSKSNPNKAMDISGGSHANNANVQLWDRNTSIARTWRFQRDANTGQYTITDVRSGKRLSVQSTSPNIGTNVVISDVNDCRSKWKVYETPDHYLSLESACMGGIMLDNAGGRTQDGNNVQVWSAHTQDAEKWSIYVGQTLNAGVYTISNASDSKKKIDNAGGWNYNANNVHIWDENHADAQKWRAEYDAAKDAYTFTNPQTNKRLDLAGAGTALNTNVQIWDPVNACSQYWKLIDKGDGYMLLSTCSPSRAVDLAGGVTTNGNNIRLWEVNNANAEKWHFHNQRIIEDGDYEITSKANRDYAIDIAGAANYDAANVNLYKANRVSAAQLWRVRYNTQTGDYTLLNQYGNRSLDLAGGNTSINTNIQIWSNNSACAQRWTLLRNDDGSYTFISTCQYNRALDLAGGEAFNNNNIRLWEANGADAQKWNFKRTQVVANGVYTIAAKNDPNKVVGIFGNKSDNGTNIHLQENGTNGQKRQEWEFTYDVHTGYYHIVNPDTGKALDLSGCGIGLGTNIHLWESNTACAQQWRALRRDDDTYVFVSGCSGDRAVDLAGGITTNGNNIRLWEVNNADAQKWQLKKAR